MSLERHPNFHAVNFNTQIMTAYYESLRGGANQQNAPDISDTIVEFVSMIENRVDAAVDHTNLSIGEDSFVPAFDFADDSIGDTDDDPGKDDFDKAEEHRDDVWCRDPWQALPPELPPDIGTQ
jgi:hypothetical protein